MYINEYAHTSIHVLLVLHTNLMENGCTECVHCCSLPLQRLSTTSVPFTVLSMCHNQANEDLMVVCGLKVIILPPLSVSLIFPFPPLYPSCMA